MVYSQSVQKVKKQPFGYVPFIADKMSNGRFIRSDQSFKFPYGFKHGTILTITMDEYERLKSYKKLPSEY